MAENYMKQIADQPSAAKAEKPAPKKRPNDTVKREQSATNNKQTKVERVNPKKLASAKHVIKLTLQQKGYVPDELKRLFFEEDHEDVSILDLANKFEQVNISNTKANLLARYIVEPKYGDNQIVYNERLSIEVGKAADLLIDFVGPYQVYEDNVPFGKDEDDYCSETEMRLQCIEKFLKQLPALKDALSAEDYENSGLCDHIQIREAI